MDSTSRLYERLGQIPQNPEDPESLEDLIVCAFGAFERYYVCWKTRGGEFRQDGHDLPQQLQEWLYPADGTTRDFASLQVVFGRGNEYFASDKNGKLEYKEPEVKKPSMSTEDPDKPTALKRSRTISFLRPLSDSSNRSVEPPSSVDTPTRESPSRRSSNTSQQSSRPPSQVFSRPTSDPFSRPHSPIADTSSSQGSSRRSSFIAQPTPITSRPRAESTPRPFSPAVESAPKDPPVESPLPAQSRLVRRSRPLSMSFNPSTFPKIVEGRTLSPAGKQQQAAVKTHIPCACGCQDKPKPSYADASVQTDPESPQRTALRIDTSSDFSSFPSYSNGGSALDVQTPLTEEELPAPANPVFMGRMFDYFSRPGYQLGDSLMSSYYYYEQPVYYQDDIVYQQEDWKEGGVEQQPQQGQIVS